jgi:hypothetical protein
MRRYLMLVIGLAIIMIGLGFVMPAVAQMRDLGALPTVGVGLLLLGISLMIGGGRTVFHGSKGLRA